MGLIVRGIDASRLAGPIRNTIDAFLASIPAVCITILPLDGKKPPIIAGAVPLAMSHDVIERGRYSGSCISKPPNHEPLINVWPLPPRKALNPLTKESFNTYQYVPPIPPSSLLVISCILIICTDLLYVPLTGYTPSSSSAAATDLPNRIISLFRSLCKSSFVYVVPV